MTTQEPPGPLDAAAALPKLREARADLRAAVRSAEWPGAVGSVRSALGWIDRLIAEAERAAPREVVVVTLRVALRPGVERAEAVGGLNLDLGHNGHVLDWQWADLGGTGVQVPEPYIRGAAFRPEGERGETDDSC